MDDLKKFEKDMTEEEMKTQEDLCAKMRLPENEGGDDIRKEFND